MSTLAYNSQEPIVLHTREMVSSSSSFLFNKFEVCSFDLAYQRRPLLCFWPALPPSCPRRRRRRRRCQDFLLHMKTAEETPDHEKDRGSCGSDTTGADGAPEPSSYKQKASAFVRGARNLVSMHQKKARFKDESFDLDLTYITDRIIAMSFPATGLEAMYRNKLDDVAAMLKEKHGDKFMIINCAEKSYDSTNLCDQVLDFGWPDHMAAPLARLIAAVQAMDSWNQSDPEHVVVVHCKGGKGRTGLVIAAYMLMANIFFDVDLAMEHFAVKRFNSTDRTKTGITQMSQRRYCYYFKDVIEAKMQVRERKLFVTNLVISKVPNFDQKGGCKPVVKLFEFPAGTTQAKQFFEYPMDGVKGGDHRFHAEDGQVVIPLNVLMEKADLLVVCYHRHQSSFKKEELQTIFRCQFNSMAMFGDNETSFTLTKPDLDDTKPSDKRFPEDATVTFNFDLSRTPPDASTDNHGEMLRHKYQTQHWNVQESAAALFDNIRSAPEVLSKDDKKGWKALKHKVRQVKVESDFKASELRMTEAQRIEVMQMVANGVCSIDAAMDKVLETERQLHETTGIAAAATAAAASTGGGAANEVGSAAPSPSPSPAAAADHRESFGAGVELANMTLAESMPSSAPGTPRAAATPRLHSNPAVTTPQPTRPAPPASSSRSSSKKKQPPRPSRKPSTRELTLEGLSNAQPTSTAGPSSAPPIITSSQVPNPFGTTPPATPPHSAGGTRPASTNPFL